MATLRRYDDDPVPAVQTKPEIKENHVPECADCNALCCRAIGHIVLSADHEPDMALIRAGHFYHDENYPGVYFLPRKADRSCVFLGTVCKHCFINKARATGEEECQHVWKEHSCTIYEHRPAVCRAWTCLTPDNAPVLCAVARLKDIDHIGKPPHLYCMNTGKLRSRLRKREKELARAKLNTTRLELHLMRHINV
jgi:Fe-S-cluster containining protein